MTFFPPRRFMHSWHIYLLSSQQTLNSVCGSGGTFKNLNLALYGQFLPLSYENLMQGCPGRGLMRLLDIWIPISDLFWDLEEAWSSLFAVLLLWDDQDWISTVSHCALVQISKSFQLDIMCQPWSSYTGSETQRKAKWESLVADLGLVWVRLLAKHELPVCRVYLIENCALFCSLS